MLGELRRPFFFVSLVLLALVVLIELGSASVGAFTGAASVGWAIPTMALLDGLLLFTALVMAAPLVMPPRVVGRIQGPATLILSIVVIIVGILLVLVILGLLMLMVGLLLALPFGPLVYSALGFATFPTTPASATLSTIVLFKVIAGGALPFAHQRFLENKGLVLLIITSLLATVIISLLHGLVPDFLVSVTDLIAALIVLILALIWAVVFLFGSLPGVIKAIKP